MDQNNIIEILNRHVFREDKAALLTTIAQSPDRFIGLFRSTSPRLKLLQHLLQSREIRFGDAMEEVIRSLLSEMGFINLPKSALTEKQEGFSFDQYFASPDHSTFYLVEQKIRDDHDTSKKRGQIGNFQSKLMHLHSMHGDRLIGIMYFIDPTLHKNEIYYRTEIQTLESRLGIRVYLFYNGEFFEFLEGHTRTWDLILTSLATWRRTVPDDIMLNFDADPVQTLADLRGVSRNSWQKLVGKEALWTAGIIHIIFPTGETLKHLQEDFARRAVVEVGRRRTEYQQLAYLLEQQLNKYYPSLSS